MPSREVINQLGPDRDCEDHYWSYMKKDKSQKSEVVEEPGEYSTRGDFDHDLPSIKKPSMDTNSNTGYLGHFAKEEFLSKGHNDMDMGGDTMPTYKPTKNFQVKKTKKMGYGKGMK